MAQYFVINSDNPQTRLIKHTVEILQAGGIIAYPTEAVYGLGCDPLIPEAVFRLLRLKQRDPDKGLILIASDFYQLRDYIKPLDARTMAPVLDTWPGPHTWLLPAQTWVPHWIRGKHDTIAVRVTNHPIAAALCKTTGSALISTSANISRRPAARIPSEIRRLFGTGIDMLLPGPLGDLETPTPIRDARTGAILRS